jgi:hypothetical protein
MSARHKAPRARTSGLVVKTLAEEVLVYDLTRHKAHSLNRSAAAVWRRLDGRTSIGDLARHLREDLGGPADESIVGAAGSPPGITSTAKNPLSICLTNLSNGDRKCDSDSGTRDVNVCLDL